jgi:hypothetical protein
VCAGGSAQVEDKPKALKDVIQACWKDRYKKNPAMLELLRNEAHCAALRETVLTAERALLYTLSFNFNVGGLGLHRLARPASPGISRGRLVVQSSIVVARGRQRCDGARLPHLQ